MDTAEAGEIILGALKLARERVTGDPDEKEIRRERLADLIARIRVGGSARPSAGDLKDALGDPDDSEIRTALAAWK
jgi:hypothetical protein